jgi:uncharacterized protein (TIGR00288 family)
MSNPYAYAPNAGGDRVTAAAPNAALLIDFDNVTMGMRSDLSKDLRKLLQSDVIRGKVTVQRAYADWRRYPQYIVPLSENSIDLIFAPAYGSSKKNATDIRMAIDGMELVFTRPEIGVYILLTGDSDFSSLVLKLKEYGKYVIGVGIQESSSDILVQNCDEYYSYTNLAGLQKTTETDVKSMDPWVLVDKAVRKMKDRKDVMRSDRLKQVMIEIDSTFDEGSYGFSKFSKFVTEAASRNIISLKKMPNGQYEVEPGSSSGGGSRRKSEDDRGRGRSRRGRDRDSERKSSSARPEPIAESGGEETDTGDSAPSADSLDQAFGLLTRCLTALRDADRYPVRDSDVKRKLLELDEDFDESTLGFSKFSLFLKAADEKGVVRLERQDGGSYEVSLGEGPVEASGGTSKADSGRTSSEADSRKTSDEGESRKKSDRSEGDDAASGPVSRDLRPEDVIGDDTPGRRLGPRGGTTRRRDDDGPPPLFEGQGRPSDADDSGSGEGEGGDDTASGDAGGGTPVDLASADLPTDPDEVVKFLTSFKGVGEKTARQVVERFGDDLFQVLHERPSELAGVVPAGRADQLVAGLNAALAERAEGGRSGGRKSGGRNRRGGRSGRSRRGGRSGGRKKD